MTKNQGFTLIELMISTAIIIIIVAAIFLLQNFLIDQQNYTLNSFISTDYANRSVEKLVKELRNSRNADNGAYTFETLNDQALSFYTNTDKDSQIEKVRYYLEGSTFYRSVIDPSGYPVEYLEENEIITPLAENVANETNPLFYYYNSDWPQDQSNNPLPIEDRLTQTKIIKIDLSLENKNKAENNYQINTFVQIRTLKDNL
jgi:prepilin-type N-terminal cleavage/methylation domain-containing protein